MHNSSHHRYVGQQAGTPARQAGAVRAQAVGAQADDVVAPPNTRQAGSRRRLVAHGPPSGPNACAAGVQVAARGSSVKYGHNIGVLQA